MDSWVVFSLVFTALGNAFAEGRGFNCDFPIINSCGQVYLYDADTEQVEPITRAMDGMPGNGGSFQAVISENGRVIAFASEASNLVADDTNGVSDLFIFNRDTGQVTRLDLTTP